MLDGIDTGYEGKFDFPQHTDRPRLSYLLVSVPRAGSTHFSHLLWKSGCLGAPLEYLNFERSGPYGFAASSAKLQQQLWSSVLRRRCSPNGVFGLKAFIMQFDQLNQTNPQLLQQVLGTVLPRGGRRHIIYLRRRDRVAQVISYARASLSGIWRKEQESGEQRLVEYSQEALEAGERGILFQEDAWEMMFNDLAIEPLAMWHEDVLADPEGAAATAARYLGVTLEQGAAVDVPAIQKQSEYDAPDWRAKYIAVKKPA